MSVEILMMVTDSGCSLDPPLRGVQVKPGSETRVQEDCFTTSESRDRRIDRRRSVVRETDVRVS